MKTILIPTDFSQCADNALRYAACLAKKTGATINLLHVLEVPTIGPQGSIESTVDDVPYMIGLLKVTEVKMKKRLTLPYLRGIKVIHNIETGNIREHILKAAEKYQAAAIVMGTHGMRGLGGVLIGSNSEKIIRDSKIPVFIIKDEIKEPKIEKIIYATDFSDETEFVFPEIQKLAELLGAKIEIVKVVTRLQFESTHKTERSIARFKKKFNQSNYSTSVYYDSNKQDGIRRFAYSTRGDLIALGTHGKGGMAHFFDDRIAEDLVNDSSLPVLTINCSRKSTKSGIAFRSDSNVDTFYYSHQIPVL